MMGLGHFVPDEIKLGGEIYSFWNCIYINRYHRVGQISSFC